jgi:predicted ATP-grasp superfamily ATP-dependent carboligase
MRVLIPERSTPNVLSTIRALGRGHEFTLKRGGSLEERMRSRCRARTVPIPDPTNDEAKFTRRLKELAGNFDALMPFGHNATVAISQNLGDIEIPTQVPPYYLLRHGHDKSLTVRTCTQLGVPCPRTWSPHDDPPSFPVVIKARKNCGVHTGIRYAADEEELRRGLEEMAKQPNVGNLSSYDDPIIQEMVPGPIHDCVGLYQNGEPKALLTQVRVETTPLDGGVGAYNRTTHNPDLIELSRRLLDGISWHGPFQAEYKLDSRDDRYKLLELNPKMWGTLELSMKAGINVPEMAMEVARGGDVEPQFDYRVGVKHVWPFPLVWRNFLERPSPGRLARLFYHPVSITDPWPDLYRIMVSIVNAKSYINGSRSRRISPIGR